MKSQNKKKFQWKTKHLLTLFMLLSAVLIGLSFFYEDAAEPIKTAFARIIVPLQKGTNAVSSSILSLKEKNKDLEELKKENESLKTELEELKEWSGSISSSLDALNRLEELYDLDLTYDQYPKVAASVIGKNAGNWFRQFTIDKGTKDGIEPGMNVIAGGGLVGIIIECGENYSVVRSIIDEESNVSAVISSENTLCVLIGSVTAYDDGYLELSEIPKDVEVTEGSAVLTSQISSQFLPGLLIGYVTQTFTDKNNLTRSGRVTLAADFSQINEVLVLTTLKKDYIEEE